MPTRNKSPALRRYHERVSAMGCALCRRLGQPAHPPATIHHIREGQGMAQRASDWLVIPLCPGCHQGSRGFHGDRTLLRIAKVSELDLLADTIERYVETVEG